MSGNEEDTGTQSAGTQEGAAKQPTIDEAELNELRAVRERYEKLTQRAKEVDVDSVEEYIELLEEPIITGDDQKAGGSTGDGQKEPEQKPQPQTAQPQQSNAAQSRALAEAKLVADRAEYRVLPAGLPEDERTTATMDDLKGILKKEIALVWDIARKKYDGNVYMGAAELHDIRNAKKRIADQAKAQEAAKNSATESARLGTGGASKPAGDADVATKLKEIMDAESKKIAGIT